MSRRTLFLLSLFYKDVTGVVRVGCPIGASQEQRMAVSQQGCALPYKSPSSSSQWKSRDSIEMVTRARAESCNHPARPQWWGWCKPQGSPVGDGQPVQDWAQTILSLRLRPRLRIWFSSQENGRCKAAPVIPQQCDPRLHSQAAAGLAWAVAAQPHKIGVGGSSRGCAQSFGDSAAEVVWIFPAGITEKSCCFTESVFLETYCGIIKVTGS